MIRFSPQSGFTLIEMIVSLAVFSGVITISVGALLVLVGTNEQLQGEQSVMTNLSFALDSMTREIRTGTDYYCDSAANDSGNNVFNDSRDLDTVIALDDTSDCSGVSNAGHSHHGIAFREGGDSISGASSERILYYYNSDVGQLFRRVGDQDSIPIVSSGIYIHNAEFFVTGSAPQSDLAGNFKDQAIVTVFIEASENANDAVEDRYQIQTSITQRTLDI